MTLEEELAQFMNSTEEGNPGITSAQKTKSIEYPFLYITNFTDVELTYLAENKYLSANKMSDNQIGLYLHSGSGYRLLGYTQMDFTHIIRISYLMPHTVYIKTNKDTTRELTNELFDSLLLTS